MEAILFLLGFSAIVTTYEVSKSSKATKGNNLSKIINSTNKKLPKA